MSRLALAVSAAALLIWAAPASAVVAPSGSVASAQADAFALAGPRVAWAVISEFSIVASDGGRARALAEIGGDDDDSFAGVPFLAGSRHLLGWEVTFVNDDDRLTVDVDGQVWSRFRGRNRRLVNCYGDPDGLDVSGRVMAVGKVSCARGDLIQVRDYSRLRNGRPAVHRIRAEFPIAAIEVAGPYVAWQEYEFGFDHVVVWNWKLGRESYRFIPPDEQGLTFDLQADGKLAFSWQPDRSRAVGRVGWVTRQDQTVRMLPQSTDFSGVHIRGDRIAFTRIGASPDEQARPFVVTDLQGNVQYEAGAGSRSYLEDFDGQCLAWRDETPRRRGRRRLRPRLMVSAVAPEVGSARGSACGFARVAKRRLSRRAGAVALPVHCRLTSGRGCRGSLTVTSGRRKVRRRYFVRVGQTRAIRMRLPRSWRRARVELATGPVAGVRSLDAATVAIKR